MDTELDRATFLTALIDAIPEAHKGAFLKEIAQLTISLLLSHDAKKPSPHIFSLHDLSYYASIVSVKSERDEIPALEGTRLDAGVYHFIPNFDHMHSLVVPWGNGKNVGIHYCQHCKETFLSDTGFPEKCTKCKRRTWKFGLTRPQLKRKLMEADNGSSKPKNGRRRRARGD